MKYPGLTIAIVEDYAILRELMSIRLEHAGFKVEAFEGAYAFYRFLAFRPTAAAFHPTIIAVLDIGLVGEDGLSICNYLRSRDPSMGIVIVSGRALREDKLAGLTAGADAYLVKPVDMDELLLTLNRLALRFLPAVPDAQLATDPPPDYWAMQADSNFLASPNGVRIRLSVNEAQVLRVLLKTPGTACSHAELGRALGMLEEEFEKHRIEVIISRMRTKVERSAGIALPVESCRGFGYRMVY
jgi:DNA-binding response OmpR family regulator